MVDKRGIVFVLLVMGLMLVSLSCSTAQETPLPLQTASQTPSGSRNLTCFPVQQNIPNGYLTGLINGKLVIENNALRVESMITWDEPTPGMVKVSALIIWPYGYSFNAQSDKIQILDDKGQAVAAVGDQVFIGGGEIPEAEKYLTQPLPKGIEGPYWLATPGVYNAPPSASTPNPVLQ